MKITTTPNGATVKMQPREIHGHPDRFVQSIGDEYHGVRIVRDSTIPINELHMIDGTHRMVMRFKDAV